MHVITGLGIGGAERMLLQVAGELQRRGMPQHVVGMTALDDRRAELESRGVRVTLLGLKSAGGAIGGVGHLAALIKEWRPDVLQGWMYHGNVLAALAHRLAGGRKSRALYWNLRASNMDDARYKLLVRLGALLSRWPDAVIANSEAGMGHHLSRGFRPRRADVIANGIDTDLFRPDRQARARLRAELGIAPDAIVAIHVARVDPMKDHGSFLEAMRRLPWITGIMAGAGTELLPPVTNVRALGPRADVAALYAAADVIVSTSAFGEGFSNVIAEGMSAGLVPVATDVGDARLIVGDAGHVVPPRDPEILAKAIAIEANAPDREARGGRARQRIEELFALPRAVDAYESLYAEHVVGARPLLIHAARR